MTYEAFLARVIDDGIAAATADYANDAQKRTGAIDGFELCRSLEPIDLAALYEATQQDVTRRVLDINTAEKGVCFPVDYWYWRCRALEVEWVCDVVSAALVNEGLPPVLHTMPGSRAVVKAAEILGVRTEA